MIATIDRSGLFFRGWVVVWASCSLTAGCGQSPTPQTLATEDERSTRTIAPAATDRRTIEASAAAPADRPSLKVRPRSRLRKGGICDITFDDLEFDIEPDEDFEDAMLTDSIRALDGQKIIVRGFILGSSVFRQTGIRQFVLVRDNQQCCFGPGAKIYHNMQVEMAEGQTADFSIRPITLQGTFRIKPWRAEDGKCYSVFHVTADRAR